MNWFCEKCGEPVGQLYFFLRFFKLVPRHICFQKVKINYGSNETLLCTFKKETTAEDLNYFSKELIKIFKLKRKIKFIVIPNYISIQRIK